jgi:hypothetical protein
MMIWLGSGSEAGGNVPGISGLNDDESFVYTVAITAIIVFN